MSRRDRLTTLQKRVLVALAGMEPPWTLTGGAALAGFHLGHRETRDLDLFFRGHHELSPEMLRQAERRLDDAAFHHERLELGPAFARYRVDDGGDVVVVDLVAEPVASVEAPAQVEIDGRELAIDSAHEILTNKLNTLISRAELRDLLDAHELVAAGGDLGRALEDAARKDRGFSPLVLAECLATFPVAPLARRAGLGAR